MLITGTPLGAARTVGRWPPGADGSAMIWGQAAMGASTAKAVRTALADAEKENGKEEEKLALPDEPQARPVAPDAPLPLLVAVSCTTMRKPRAALKMTL